MLDPKSPETNNPPRRRRSARLLTCLALLVACLAGAARARSQQPSRGGDAQPQKSATPQPQKSASSQPQTSGASQPQKSGAPQASRARRVADKPEARATAGRPAKAVTATVGRATPDAEPARTDEPPTSGAAAGGEPEAKGGAKKSAAPADSKKPAAAREATARPLGAEGEIERLRAELKSAEGESRARAQRELVDRLVALDRKADALSELRLMIHEDRYDPTFFYNTGNALARLGDANAAADAYRKAVSQRRGNYARALNNLGVVLTRQGRWDEAYDALNAALTQENFLYAEASYNLGRLYLLRGESNLAEREWSRTLRLQPDHADAAAALARALADEGDEKRAAAVLENFTARAARTGATVPRQIAYAREAIAAARADEREDSRDGSATAAANSAAPRSTAPASRRYELDGSAHRVFESARAAAERGQHEEAVRHYERVIKQQGGYFAPANLELGLALLNLKRWYDALAVLQPVAERESARFPVAHYHLARLYEQLGRNEDAAVQFARAARLYGDTNPQMLVDLSRVREKSGDVRGALEAVEAYSVAIAKQGSVPHWVVARADALRAKLKDAPARP